MKWNGLIVKVVCCWARGLAFIYSSLGIIFPLKLSRTHNGWNWMRQYQVITCWLEMNWLSGGNIRRDLEVLETKYEVKWELPRRCGSVGQVLVQLNWRGFETRCGIGVRKICRENSSRAISETNAELSARIGNKKSKVRMILYLILKSPKWAINTVCESGPSPVELLAACSTVQSLFQVKQLQLQRTKIILEA